MNKKNISRLMLSASAGVVFTEAPEAITGAFGAAHDAAVSSIANMTSSLAQEISKVQPTLTDTEAQNMAKGVINDTANYSSLLSVSDASTLSKVLSGVAKKVVTGSTITESDLQAVISGVGPASLLDEMGVNDLSLLSSPKMVRVIKPAVVESAVIGLQLAERHEIAGEFLEAARMMVRVSELSKADVEKSRGYSRKALELFAEYFNDIRRNVGDANIIASSRAVLKEVAKIGDDLGDAAAYAKVAFCSEKIADLLEDNAKKEIAGLALLVDGAAIASAKNRIANFELDLASQYDNVCSSFETAAGVSQQKLDEPLSVSALLRKAAGSKSKSLRARAIAADYLPADAKQQLISKLIDDVKAFGSPSAYALSSLDSATALQLVGNQEMYSDVLLAKLQAIDALRSRLVIGSTDEVAISKIFKDVSELEAACFVRAQSYYITITTKTDVQHAAPKSATVRLNHVLAKSLVVEDEIRKAYAGVSSDYSLARSAIDAMLAVVEGSGSCKDLIADIEGKLKVAFVDADIISLEKALVFAHDALAKGYKKMAEAYTTLLSVSASAASASNDFKGHKNDFESFFKYAKLAGAADVWTAANKAAVAILANTNYTATALALSDSENYCRAVRAYALVIQSQKTLRDDSTSSDAAVATVDSNNSLNSGLLYSAKVAADAIQSDETIASAWTVPTTLSKADILNQAGRVRAALAEAMKDAVARHHDADVRQGLRLSAADALKLAADLRSQYADEAIIAAGVTKTENMDFFNTLMTTWKGGNKDATAAAGASGTLKYVLTNTAGWDSMEVADQYQLALDKLDLIRADLSNDFATTFFMPMRDAHEDWKDAARMYSDYAKYRQALAQNTTLTIDNSTFATRRDDAALKFAQASDCEYKAIRAAWAANEGVTHDSLSNAKNLGDLTSASVDSYVLLVDEELLKGMRRASEAMYNAAYTYNLQRLNSDGTVPLTAAQGKANADLMKKMYGAGVRDGHNLTNAAAGYTSDLSKTKGFYEDAQRMAGLVLANVVAISAEAAAFLENRVLDFADIYSQEMTKWAPLVSKFADLYADTTTEDAATLIADSNVRSKAVHLVVTDGSKARFDFDGAATIDPSMADDLKTYVTASNAIASGSAGTSKAATILLKSLCAQIREISNADFTYAPELKALYHYIGDTLVQTYARETFSPVQVEADLVTLVDAKLISATIATLVTNAQTAISKLAHIAGVIAEGAYVAASYVDPQDSSDEARYAREAMIGRNNVLLGLKDLAYTLVKKIDSIPVGQDCQLDTKASITRDMANVFLHFAKAKKIAFDNSGNSVVSANDVRAALDDAEYFIAEREIKWLEILVSAEAGDISHRNLRIADAYKSLAEVRSIRESLGVKASDGNSSYDASIERALSLIRHGGVGRDEAERVLMDVVDAKPDRSIIGRATRELANLFKSEGKYDNVVQMYADTVDLALTKKDVKGAFEAANKAKSAAHLSGVWRSYKIAANAFAMIGNSDFTNAWMSGLSYSQAAELLVSALDFDGAADMYVKAGDKMALVSATQAGHQYEQAVWSLSQLPQTVAVYARKLEAVSKGAVQFEKAGSTSHVESLSQSAYAWYNEARALNPDLNSFKAVSVAAAQAVYENALAFQEDGDSTRAVAAEDQLNTLLGNFNTGADGAQVEMHLGNLQALQGKYADAVLTFHSAAQHFEGAKAWTDAIAAYAKAGEMSILAGVAQNIESFYVPALRAIAANPAVDSFDAKIALVDQLVAFSDSKIEALAEASAVLDALPKPTDVVGAAHWNAAKVAIEARHAHQATTAEELDSCRTTVAPIVKEMADALAASKKGSSDADTRAIAMFVANAAKMSVEMAASCDRLFQGDAASGRKAYVDFAAGVPLDAVFAAASIASSVARASERGLDDVILIQKTAAQTVLAYAKLFGEYLRTVGDSSRIAEVSDFCNLPYKLVDLLKQSTFDLTLGSVLESEAKDAMEANFVATLEAAFNVNVAVMVYRQAGNIKDSAGSPDQVQAAKDVVSAAADKQSKVLADAKKNAVPVTGNPDSYDQHKAVMVKAAADMAGSTGDVIKAAADIAVHADPSETTASLGAAFKQIQQNTTGTTDKPGLADISEKVLGAANVKQVATSTAH